MPSVSCRGDLFSKRCSTLGACKRKATGFQDGKAVHSNGKVERRAGLWNAAVYDKDEEMLPEVPMDDFMLEPPLSVPPSAAPSSRAMSHQHDSLMVDDTPMMDDDLPLPALEVQPDSAR